MSNGRPKILIVDDDLDTLKLVGLLLQRQGYEVTAAHNGVKALLKAKQEQPDLILLDVMMPDMDGYEVAKRLRADASTANIPILMFTAKSQVDDKLSGFEAGADDYITKPAHPAELLARVKRLLSRPPTGPLPPEQVGGGPTPQAKTIGLIGAKGGVGLTTLALNLALALQRRGETKVTLAELRPGQGTLASELDITGVDTLAHLLRQDNLTTDEVRSRLLIGPADIRLLPGTFAPEDLRLLHPQRLGHLVERLRQLPGLLLLDMGPGLAPWWAKVLPQCDRLLIVLDNTPTALPLAQAIVTALRQQGFTPAQIGVVYIQRVPLGVQRSWEEVQAIVNAPVLKTLPPAPEQAMQAARTHSPIVLSQPNSLYAEQVGRLAERLHKEIFTQA